MLKIVIIDDAPKAIKLLENYIGRVAFLNCLASFRNPIEGLDYIQNQHVDLVLLDINMPKLSGISLAKIINPTMNIIFTTAYSEHAVESYNLNAIDYLLKPITFDRFLKAVTKVQANKKTKTDRRKGSKSISVKSGYVLHRINLDDILYLEKDANYMTYHTIEKKILARESVSETLEKLSSDFIQIHKSYIIPIDKIESVDSNHIVIKDSKLPIGKNYKENLMRFLK